MKELLRQSAHIIFVLLLAAFSFIRQKYFIIITFLLLIISILLLYFKPLIIRKAIRLLERKKTRFKGKGLITVIIGALLTGLLFPGFVSVALFILAFGDGLSTITGVYFGKKNLLWSDKTIIGSLTFFIVSFVISMLFVPLTDALVISIFSSALESIDYDSLLVDDNIIVPLAVGIAGTIMLLV